MFIVFVLWQLFFYSVPAAAQGKRNDPGIAAQQAFVRLDYNNALRFALEALKTAPQNQDLRRIAARSALELQKANECLKIMGAVSPLRMTNDDVNIIGECANSSGTPGAIIPMLQKSQNRDETKDAANYWIGSYYYKKGDYAQAKQLLMAVVLLPVRFEKERKFMLERINEVLDASKQPTLPVTKTPEPKSNAESKETTLIKETTSSKENTPGDSNKGNVFKSFELTAETALHLTKGTAVDLSPNDQQEYENRLGSQNPDSAVNNIVSRNLSDISASASSEMVIKLGLKLDSANYLGSTAKTKNFAKSTSQPAVSNSHLAIASSFAGSLLSTQNSQWNNAVYSFQRRDLPRLAPYEAPRKGWEARIGPCLLWSPFRNLQLHGAASVGYGTATPQKPSRIMRASAGFGLAFDNFEIQPGAAGQFYFSSGGEFAAWDSQWDLDINIFTLNLISNKHSRVLGVGLASKPGYPTFAYTRVRPKSSQDVIKFTNLEGNYLELNIAPYLLIGESVQLSTLYRFVNATKQSYTAPSIAKLKAEQGKLLNDWSLYKPTAEYKSTSAEWLAEIVWSPNSAVQLQTGVLFRRSVTQYVEGNGTEENIQFAGLLDRGGDSWNRYHVGFSYRL